MADIIILKVITGQGDREEQINVNPTVLSQWSSFFQARNSDRWNKKHSLLCTISEDEEQVYTDLLTGAISNTEQSHLLNILRVAEKYNFLDIAGSPVTYCIHHLRDGVGTKEQAAAILDFHGEVLWTSYNTLRILARDFMHSTLTDFEQLEGELMDWTVELLWEFLLTNDKLKIGGEYDLFAWLCRMDKEKALSLLGAIRFPLMSLDELDKVTESALAVEAIRYVSDAFRLMHRVPYKRGWSPERRYIRVPTRTTVDLAYNIAPNNRHPLNRCTILMSLTREDLQRVAREGRVESHEFCFGGHKLKLIPRRQKSNTPRNIKEGQDRDHLGLAMISEGDSKGKFIAKVYMRADSGLMEEIGREKLVFKGGEETFRLPWLIHCGSEYWTLYMNDGQLDIKVEIFES